jgi:opacity protein-like surface antigen
MIRFLASASFSVLIATAASAQTTVPVGHFEGVELNGGGHIVLRHGDIQRVTLLKGSTQYTKFHIEDGKNLVVDVCDSNCPTFYDLSIEITTPDIQSVGVNGGGSISTAAGFPAQRNLTAAIQGGGKIDTTSVDATAVSAAIQGGGELRVRAHNALTAAVNGGGDIRYAGSPHVTSAINGGGNVSRDGA